jgi:osmotically-inducible protein OsmY
METSTTSTQTQRTTDEKLQKDVLDELKWDARVSPNEIGVSVKDRIVTLTGYVEAYTKRWAAEEAARRVRGVRAVANEIEVRLPSSSERTDADIAAAAARALEWDSVVSPEQVKATVSKGWVTLNGEVEWQYQKADAERVVRRLMGVKGVTNLIQVKPKLSPSNIKDKIEDALTRSVKADAENIQVEVHGSTVVLKGNVRSYLEKQEAERAAWMAPGVVSVDNRLVITYS